MLQSYFDDAPMYINGQRVSCAVDGMAISCSQAFSMLQIGSADIDFRTTSSWTLSQLGIIAVRHEIGNINAPPPLGAPSDTSYAYATTQYSYEYYFSSISWSPQVQTQNSKYDEKIVKDAVKEAIKLTKKEDCDKALNDITDGQIPSLNALVSQYLDGNGNLANISDGSSRSTNFGINNPNVPAFVENAGHSDSSTYINSAFFSIAGNKLGAIQAKAIVLIHEAVHQFLKGSSPNILQNRDIYYNEGYHGEMENGSPKYTKEQQEVGSRNLTNTKL